MSCCICTTTSYQWEVFFIICAHSRAHFLVTMASPNQERRWSAHMLKLVFAAGDGHAASERFDDKNKFSLQKRLAYFPAEDEVRIGDIERALSFCYRSWKFFVAPDWLGP